MINIEMLLIILLIIIGSVCAFLIILIKIYSDKIIVLNKEKSTMVINNVSSEFKHQNNDIEIPKLYYDYVRDEIEHEDNITNQRLTWAITFQGFLIGAIGVLVGFNWTGGDAVIALRKVILAVLPVMGISFGIIALGGIWASRKAIEKVKEDWEERNNVWGLYPNRVPQAYGQGSAFNVGTGYAVWIAKLFIVTWLVILLAQIMFILKITIPHCETQSVDVLRCIFTDVGSHEARLNL
ncbi:hypothetical protein [Ancylobacter amanitiformis]|uniref:Uncharacterized protein n=1 Tax=Ancylobacter amanitiformis TaxID=217069 RepID=A0ABU0LU98_9HYPH|nr:hypothetical protein [Ancylobacter amanitiformis]MDQ0512271.1 hypothetical protein [Ancylobacter amanitiformis]